MRWLSSGWTVSTQRPASVCQLDLGRLPALPLRCYVDDWGVHAAVFVLWRFFEIWPFQMAEASACSVVRQTIAFWVSV